MIKEKIKSLVATNLGTQVVLISQQKLRKQSYINNQITPRQKILSKYICCESNIKSKLIRVDTNNYEMQFSYAKEG